MSEASPLPLASFKLQLVEARIRIVPALGLDGCAFAGPGVDIVGDEARRTFALAEPVFGWLHAREPGITIRSLSMDLARLRILVTYAHAGVAADARPHVLSLVAPHSSELVALAQPLVAALGTLARDRLARRTS